MASSPGLKKQDTVFLTAEILDVDDEKNTCTINVNGISIEIDKETLSKSQLVALQQAQKKQKPDVKPKSNTFFSDMNIGRQIVISRWTELVKRTNNIDDDDTIQPSELMEIESSQECDAWFLRECPQTQRLCFILQFYKIWIEHQSLNNEKVLKTTFSYMVELLEALKGYSYKQLMNDFHHLKSYHINISQKDTTDDIFKYFKKNCTDSNQCHDKNCRSYSRNTRDREMCRNAQYRRNLYFIRDNLTNGRNNNNRKGRIKNGNKNNVNDFVDVEVEECNIQDLLDTIHSSLIHYDFHDMTLSNKFVTHFEGKTVDDTERKKGNENDDEKRNESDDDQIEENGGQKHSGEYGFGIAFKYTDKSSTSSYYCPKKYPNLKQELLNNSISHLDKFEYASIAKKAEGFLDTWNAKQKMQAKSMGTWNANYGIKAGNSAQVQHILVLMSYTNFDALQREFKKTYRKKYPNEPRKEVTKRHQEIANWASLLDQCMTFYSERLTDDNARFYHGINCQLKFTQFQAFFLCPTSTTTIPTIAYNFASSEGVVIALTKADTRGPVFVNVSFLSDYPKEEERLIMCNNWSFNNIIYKGMSTKYYVKCLKLFQKITNGSFISHDKQLFQIKYQKTVVRMMDNFMNKKFEENIPSYLQTLFNHFCNNIDTIWINEEQFTSYIPELQSYLMIKEVKTRFSRLMGKSDNMEFGKFSKYVQENVNKDLELQKVSHFKWKIDGQQLDSFWRGKQIKGEDIKCDISHLGGNNNNNSSNNNNNNNKKPKTKKNKNHQFVFYPLCKQHTVKDDGRFRYGLKLESYPEYINSFTFRFEFSIPEIKFYDGETMESKGKGAVGDNRFESAKLKKLQNGFTIEIIISIRSASLH